MDQLPSPTPGLEILAEVGRGTTGVVYLARDLRNKRLVALKLLLHGSAAERHIRAARFRREARYLACMAPHANIPTIHALMESQGEVYYIRELIEGATLKDWVDSRAVSKSEGIQVLTGIEAALTSMHEKGIVHRNLQPENVLVAKDGTAKLIGFSRAADIDALVGHGTTAEVLEAEMQAFGAMRDWMLSSIG